jgi:hypothetical protein
VGTYAVWLTRESSEVGDPSLRLINGCAQDDIRVVRSRKCTITQFCGEIELDYHLKEKSLAESFEENSL